MKTEMLLKNQGKTYTGFLPVLNNMCKTVSSVINVYS